MAPLRDTVDDFKLSDDDTMRHLRSLAQSPGELQWRLDLLSALDRMRVQQEVTNKGILQIMSRLRKDVSHLTPMKLAELMNAQIEQKMKATEKDVGRLWKAGVWILERAALVVCTYIGIKGIS